MKKIYFLLLIALTQNCFSQEIVKKHLHPTSTMTDVNGHLLFAADTGFFPTELWTTDGTYAGTHVVKQFTNGIFPSEGSGYESYNPVAYQNELYFFANDSTNTHGLWKSDGTAPGTVLLKNFGTAISGPFGDDFPFFCGLNNEVYFAAGDGTHGVELWRTDGTPSGTVLFKDISTNTYYGSTPAYLINFKNKIYFSAYYEGTGVNVWVTDGTDTGTHILKHFLPTDTLQGLLGNGSGSIDPQFIISGNYLFFTGRKNTASYMEYLYRTDGTEAGTIILDTVDQRYDPIDGEDQPFSADVNGELYFMGVPADPNLSLIYKSDGTPAGTVNVPTNDTINAEGDFFSFNGKLYFHGVEGNVRQNNSRNDGLYVSDGTIGGTSLIKSFTSNRNLRNYTIAGNSFFYADECLQNPDLIGWCMVQCDGTPQGIKVYNLAEPESYQALYNGAFYYQGVDTVMLDTSSLYKIVPATNLGVAEVRPSNEVIREYPNPAIETIIINVSLAANENAMLNVFNLVGENVYSSRIPSSISNFPIDVSKWESGIYFCSLQDREGTRTMKVMVQH